MQKKFIVTATAAVLALGLAGCSQGSSLEDVDYSLNSSTAEPSVSFETPFSVDKTETHVIEEGSGDEVKDGDSVLIDATVFKGEDGSKVGSTYTQAPILIPVGQTLKDEAPELYDVLTSSKVGASFSYSSNMVSSQSSDGTATPSQAAKDTPTSIEVYTIKSKILKQATGKELPKQDINKALESFTLSDDGKAELKLAKDRGDAPEKLVTQNLIEGEGDKVKANDTVYVKYQGVRWEDGKVFDQNYDKEPLDISLNGVIKGWTQGLEGKKVGSRVLLIIPEALAYGKDAGEGAPAGPLVFVVDILGTSENPQAASSENPSKAPADHSATAEPTASKTAQ